MKFKGHKIDQNPTNWDNIKLINRIMGCPLQDILDEGLPDDICNV